MLIKCLKIFGVLYISIYALTTSNLTYFKKYSTIYLNILTFLRRSVAEMVKHIILWNIDDKYSASEKESIKKNIKKGLEGLMGKIPGMTEIKVNIEGLASANADLMLDSSFESEEALNAYSKNPLHVEVADTMVRPFTAKRACFDFEA